MRNACVWHNKKICTFQKVPHLGQRKVARIMDPFLGPIDFLEQIALSRASSKNNSQPF
jgi:hypothetical protein